MTDIAYILFALGWIIALAGNIHFLVLAYRRGVGWFLACLLLPIVSWIFSLQTSAPLVSLCLGVENKPHPKFATTALYKLATSLYNNPCRPLVAGMRRMP